MRGGWLFSLFTFRRAVAAAFRNETFHKAELIYMTWTSQCADRTFSRSVC